MKIARIHFPKHGNAGASLYRVHKFIQRQLIRTFGGFTYWNATGAWRDESGEQYVEPVVVYEVAHNGAPSEDTIRRIALYAGIVAKQKAVFLVFDGRAEIIYTKEARA